MEVKDWLEVGGILAAIVGNLYVYKFRIDRQDKEFEDYKREHAKEGVDWKQTHLAEKAKLERDLWREIDQLRKRASEMESKLMTMQLDTQREFSKVYLLITEQTSKFANALEKLTNIERKIDQLDQKLDTKADK